jgi:hypothetical protein
VKPGVPHLPKRLRSPDRRTFRAPKRSILTVNVLELDHQALSS